MTIFDYSNQGKMFKKAAFTKYRQRLENTLTPIWNRFQPNLLSNLPQLPWSQIDGAAHFLEHHIKPKIDEYLHGLLNAMKSYDGESNGPVSKLADEINQELESGMCFIMKISALKLL